MKMIYLSQHWNEIDNGVIELQVKKDEREIFIIESKGTPIIPIIECEDENVEIRFLNRNKTGFIYECIVVDFGKKKKYDVILNYMLTYMDKVQ